MYIITLHFQVSQLLTQGLPGLRQLNEGARFARNRLSGLSHQLAGEHCHLFSVQVPPGNNIASHEQHYLSKDRDEKQDDGTNYPF